MAAAPGARLPLYPEPLHNFQVAVSLLSYLNPNPDHSSTVSAGPPLPRDCAGRAELQHDQQEAWSAEASSHLLGFDLRLAAHSLWPRPDFHPLPG